MRVFWCERARRLEGFCLLAVHACTGFVHELVHVSISWLAAVLAYWRPLLFWLPCCTNSVPAGLQCSKTKTWAVRPFLVKVGHTKNLSSASWLEWWYNYGYVNGFSGKGKFWFALEIIIYLWWKLMELKGRVCHQLKIICYLWSASLLGVWTQLLPGYLSPFN